MIAAESSLWMTTFVIVVAGIFGLIIGSFLNVVVYRVPAGRSIVSPPSACPNCGSEIKPYDNIPVLSWLVLRGKCRGCREPISLRYPIVEAATGVFFGVVAWRFWPGVSAAGLIELVAFLYLAAISVVLALVDIDTHTLPNAIVLPAYAVGIALLVSAGILAGAPATLLGGAVGMVSLFALYFVLAFAYPGGMGYGDVKLAGVLGLFLGYLGWGQLIVGAFAAFLLGGLYALALVVARRAGRKSGIPFGPWMLAGAWIGIFIGTVVWDAYLTLFGLS